MIITSHHNLRSMPNLFTVLKVWKRSPFIQIKLRLDGGVPVQNLKRTPREGGNTEINPWTLYKFTFWVQLPAVCHNHFYIEIRSTKLDMYGKQKKEIKIKRQIPKQLFVWRLCKWPSFGVLPAYQLANCQPHLCIWKVTLKAIKFRNDLKRHKKHWQFSEFQVSECGRMEVPTTKKNRCKKSPCVMKPAPMYPMYTKVRLLCICL